MEVQARIPSYRERSAWATLIITVIVMGVYKGLTLMAGPNVDPGRAIGTFIGAVVALIVILVLVNIVLAVRTPLEPKDERDRAIERASYRNAYLVLHVCVWTVLPIALLWSGVFGTLNAAGELAGATPLRPVLVAQVLFLCLVFADCVRLLTQVVLYRRSA